MSYLHEPNYHPALTKEDNVEEFDEISLNEVEGPYDVHIYWQGISQEPAFHKGANDEYITWLEELAFKQLKNEN